MADQSTFYERPARPARRTSPPLIELKKVRREFPAAALIEAGANLGFSRGNNRALSRCRGDFLLLLNPADAYRVLNLTGFGEVAQFTGMAGVTQDAATSPAVLILALVLWTAVPLSGAAMMLRRRQI